jgi:hypothetical protein
MRMVFILLLETSIEVNFGGMSDISEKRFDRNKRERYPKISFVIWGICVL